MIFIILLFLSTAHACSTIMAGSGATIDQSVLASYSDDGNGKSDFRFVYVGAKDHEEGAMRPIYDDTEDYPRFVGTGRSPVYEPKPGQTPTKILGHIPEVAHTYGYSEGTYGVQNEMGLSMVETSCSARLFGSRKRGSIMSIDQLSRIAMERTTNARDAIKTMGELAEKYGFIAAGEAPDGVTPYPVPRGQANEGGEALGIADHENQEAWYFHILSDGDVGAIWVAQRVPDDHVSPCTNMFTIRVVNLTDSENFMFSGSMLEVAKAKGWWKEGTPFDFTAIYSSGEYLNRYYSGRRMWRVMDLVAPSMNLDPEYDDILSKPVYPFSVKPDSKVSWYNISSIMRDYYGGTPYDLMNNNIASGHGGNTARFSPYIHKSVEGSFERSIGQHRTTYSYVHHIRPEMPLPLGAMTWFGPHSAWGTVYMPFYAGSPHPDAYEMPTPTEMNRDTVMWAVRAGLNYAYSRFNKMLPELRKYQDELEAEASSLVDKWDKQFMHDRNRTALFANQNTFLETVPERWWENVFKLMFTFADGFENRPGNIGIEEADIYPGWWLKEVGYQNGPGYGDDKREI